MNEMNLEMIQSLLRDSRKEIEAEQERLLERNDLLKAMEALIQEVNDLHEQLEDAQSEVETLTQEVKDLRNEVKERDMQLSELRKVAGKVVEKTEHGDLEKVLRTYVNRSKTKNAKKRGWIKTIINEIMMTSGVQLSKETMEVLETFDDDVDKPVPKVENHFHQGSQNIENLNNQSNNLQQ